MADDGAQRNHAPAKGAKKDDEAEEDDSSSMRSNTSQSTSSMSNTSCSRTGQISEVTRVKTTMLSERGIETFDKKSDTSTSSSTFKRYKFGLTNHFLTMPDMGDQQDAKFYRKELEKFSGRERRPNKAQSLKKKANDIVAFDQAPLTNQTLNFEMPKAASGLRAQDFDDCDLSVMGPSSSGSRLSSLLSHEAEDWNRAGAVNNVTDSSEPSGVQTHIQTSHGHENKNVLDVSRVLPAGDAGLDADKCNSKAADRRYLPAAATYLHHPATAASAAASGARKLTSGTSSGTLTPRPLYHVDSCHHLKQQVGGKRMQSDECASNSLLVRLSSIMYATFLVILGCILHVSELRQKSKNSSDHIYTTVVALLGITWLLFLQMDLQRYKKYASKYILLESIFNDHQRALSKSELSSPVLMLDPTTRSTCSSSASLVNDRMSMNTEVIFKKTAYKMYQQRSSVNKLSAPGKPEFSPQRGETNREARLINTILPRNQLWLVGGNGLHAQHHQDDAGSTSGHSSASSTSSLIPAYKFLHGKMGANFYLKCGMAAFCFGHVIHEGLRFGQQAYFFATGNTHCRDSAALVAHLITPLYSFYQLFMMFKYSNLVINRHKILAKFGLMHIIGTCVTFWFRTILEEAFEDFVHKMDYFKAQNKPYNQYLDPTTGSFKDNVHNLGTSVFIVSDSPMRSWLNSLASLTSPAPGTGESRPPTVISNLTSPSSLFALMSSPMSATISPQLVRHIPDSYHCAQNTLLTTKSMNALPYLYPFTIEYNLLIAATFLSLYFNIGKIGGSSKHSLSCSSNYYTQPDNKTHHRQNLASTNGKVYLNQSNYNVSKQPSLSGTSYLGGELSDNNSSPVLYRYSSAGINKLGMHSRYYRHSGSAGGGTLPKRQQGEHLGEYKSNFVVNADCHAANKGLFLGFFVLLVTLVTIVIFFVTINKPSHLQLGIKINLVQEATLTSLILIVTLASYRQIMRLNKNPYIKDKVTTDDVLMLIPLPFFFIHSLLAFRAETATLYAPSHLTKTLLHTLPDRQFNDAASSAAQLVKINDSLATGQANVTSSRPPEANVVQLITLPTTSGHTDPIGTVIIRTNSTRLPNKNGSWPFSLLGQQAKIDQYKLLTIALNLATMIEVIIQTNFIIDGLRRCSESRYLRFKKPGRELITFAILLNITYWIVATFETKSVEQYKTEIEYYGPLPYMFISHTTLPVMLFYRYHSSVCLAEIWNRAYKSPKER